MRMIVDPAALPIPPDFKFRFQVEGERAGGFAADPGQAVLVYGSGRDVNRPLMIAFGSRDDVALIGTHGHAGTRIKIVNGTVTALYHDGMWKPGAGRSQKRIGETLIHWDSADVHSLTIGGLPDGRKIGIRGARSLGVSLGQLVRIADHLAP